LDYQLFADDRAAHTQIEASRDRSRCNNAAFALLERDVNNIRGTLGRFAPELLETEFAREIWALFEAGDLQPESVLTGVFARPEGVTDPDAVMVVIDDAREENIRRELGRQ
jgi:RIO kinase 1